MFTKIHIHIYTYTHTLPALVWKSAFLVVGGGSWSDENCTQNAAIAAAAMNAVVGHTSRTTTERRR